MWYGTFVKPVDLQADTIEQLNYAGLHPNPSSWKESKGFLTEHGIIEETDEILLQYILGKIPTDPNTKVTIPPDSSVAADLANAYERNRRRKAEDRVTPYTFIEKGKDGSFTLPSFAPAAHSEVAYKELIQRHGPPEFRHPIVHMCYKNIPDDQNDRFTLFGTEDYWAYEMLTGVNAALVIVSAIYDTDFSNSVVDLALELLPTVMERIYPLIHRVPAIHWKLSFLKCLTRDFLDFVNKNECKFDIAEKIVCQSDVFSKEEKNTIRKNGILRAAVGNILTSAIERKAEETISIAIQRMTGFNAVDNNSFAINAWISHETVATYWQYDAATATQKRVEIIPQRQRSLSNLEKGLTCKVGAEKTVIPFALSHISTGIKQYMENELTKKRQPPKGRRQKPDYRNKYEHAFSIIYPAISNAIGQFNLG